MTYSLPSPLIKLPNGSEEKNSRATPKTVWTRCLNRSGTTSRTHKFGSRTPFSRQNCPKEFTFAYSEPCSVHSSMYRGNAIPFIPNPKIDIKRNSPRNSPKPMRRNSEKQETTSFGPAVSSVNLLYFFSWNFNFNSIYHVIRLTR